MSPKENLQFAQALSAVFEAIPWAIDSDWEWHDDVWGRTIGRCPVCYAGLELNPDGTTVCPIPECHTEKENS